MRGRGEGGAGGTQTAGRQEIVERVVDSGGEKKKV